MMQFLEKRQDGTDVFWVWAVAEDTSGDIITLLLYDGDSLNGGLFTGDRLYVKTGKHSRHKIPIDDGTSCDGTVYWGHGYGIPIFMPQCIEFRRD